MLAAVGSTVLARARVVAADSATDDLPSARSVGRAGTGLVSDDTAGALYANPGGLARRSNPRGAIAVAVTDPAVSYTAPGDALAVTDQASGLIAPAVTAADGVGRVVIAAGYATTAAWSIALPAPRTGQPDADVARLFPHRYAGLGGSFTRHTAAAGAAMRVADWLALGVTARLDRVALDDDRRAWAGFAGRDRADDPSRDVEVALAGTAITPGGALGALIAPDDAPVELALAVSGSAPAHLDGSARVNSDGAPVIEAMVLSASLTLPAILTARAGARWLAERWTLEVGGELAIAPGRSAPAWTVRGVRVVDAATQVGAPLDRVPALLVSQPHGALRAALDVEVAPGLCWLTAGYAWSSSSVPRASLAPAFADTGGHTGALGLEWTAAGFTITAGWARTFTHTVTVDTGTITQVNPFDAGAAVANLGRYRTSRDVVAIGLELALD